MGFFSNIFNFGKQSSPIASMFGGGGGGGGMSSLTSMFGGGMGGGGSNPLSGMFGGGGRGSSGGGGGLDLGTIGNMSGNTTPGVNSGGGVTGGRAGATGNAVYPTANGAGSGTYPLAFLGALTGSEAIYGRKPDYPLAPTPDEILRSNLYANLSNQPQAQQFAGNTNQFNQGQLTGLYNQTTPGLFDARSQHLSNVSDRLAGRLPQSDIDAIKNTGAAWGLSSGTGSPRAGNQAGDYTLRDLGLKTYEQQRLAGGDLENLISSTRRDIMTPLSDPTQSSLQPSYNPYAEDQRLIDIAKVLAAPVPSAAGAAAAQQALIEGILAAYSGSPKSGSTDPQKYYVNWDGGNSGGAGSGEPGYGGGGGNNRYLQYNTGGNSTRGIGYGIGSLFGGG